jgi:hypothetical protein
MAEWGTWVLLTRKAGTAETADDRHSLRQCGAPTMHETASEVFAHRELAREPFADEANRLHIRRN